MPSEIVTLVDLFTRPEFLAGLVLGTVALVLLLIAPTELRSWGVALAAVVAIGVNLAEGRRLAMTLGVVLLAVGGGLLDGRRVSGERSPLWPWLIVGGGALLVTTRGGLAGDVWLQLAAPMAIVGSGYLMSKWPEGESSPMLGPLFLVTAFGIWVTVPETETARVVLGAAIPLAAATSGHIGARLRAPGAYALAGLLVWIVAVSGIPRPASIVGGWASLGLFLLMPLVVEKGAARLSRWSVFGIHAVMVVLASRVIGLWTNVLPALVAAAALMAVGYVVLTSINRPTASTS